MITGKSAGGLLGAVLMLVATSAAAQTVGADRIYAAEARAAALEAENKQLRHSLSTQSSAIRRLEQELDIIRQTGEMQLKDMRAAKIAADQRIEQLQQVQSQELMRASELETQASAAQADAVRMEGLLAEQQAQRDALSASLKQKQAEIAELQRLLSEQDKLVGKSVALEAQLQQANAENAALQANLSQSQASLNETQQQLSGQLGPIQSENAALKDSNEKMRASLEQMQLQLQESRDGMRNMQSGLNELTTLKAQLTQTEAALLEAENRAQASMTELVELRRTVGTDLQPTREENERLKLQVGFLNERLNAAQAANAAAPKADEIARRDMQNEELQQALNQANAQVSELRATQQSLQDQLAMAQAAEGNDAQLQADMAALQGEYQQLMDGLHSCETRAQKAEQAAQQSQAQSAPSSLPEDIRRISELETALDRANQEIRNLNQAFEGELQLERAMAAGTQAELESSYQSRINELQAQLNSCRGG